VPAAPGAEPDRSALRDDLVVGVAGCLPLVFFALTERRLAGVAGFPLDDSWIHLHFARNIAEGAGFSYNPGVPVAGSTAPLWTLLLALGVVVFGSSVAMVKAVGVITSLGATIVVRRAAIAWGACRLSALAAAVALAWTGAMAWGALSGMEVTLAALLVAASLFAHARGRDPWTALWAALAAVARPEALLLVPLLAMARPLTIRRALLFAGITAMVLAPFVGFSFATVGTAVPATATAKIEGGLLGWLSGVREPVRVTWLARPAEFFGGWTTWLWTTDRLLPLGLLAAMALVWRRVGRALAVPALALVLHPLAMALLAPYREPAFQEGRYSIHLLPVAFVVLAVALGARVTRSGIALVVAYLALAVVALPPAAARYGWAVQNINAMQVHLGRWVDEHVPRRQTIALNDIGAIAYFSRREVIDLMGLVSPDVLAYRRAGDAGILRYLTERCPGHVIVFPAWFPSLTARRDLLEPVYRVRLDHNTVAGADEMVVYRLVGCGTLRETGVLP
jgi:arabinofuranosyltransferase